jgi:hypothetical protein
MTKFFIDDLIKMIGPMPPRADNVLRMNEIYKVIDTSTFDGKQIIVVSYKGEPIDGWWMNTEKFVLYRRKRK